MVHFFMCAPARRAPGRRHRDDGVVHVPRARGVKPDDRTDRRRRPGTGPVQGAVYRGPARWGPGAVAGVRAPAAGEWLGSVGCGAADVRSAADLESRAYRRTLLDVS